MAKGPDQAGQTVCGTSQTAGNGSASPMPSIVALSVVWVRVTVAGLSAPGATRYGPVGLSGRMVVAPGSA